MINKMNKQINKLNANRAHAVADIVQPVYLIKLFMDYGGIRAHTIDVIDDLEMISTTHTYSTMLICNDIKLPAVRDIGGVNCMVLCTVWVCLCVYVYG